MTLSRCLLLGGLLMAAVVTGLWFILSAPGDVPVSVESVRQIDSGYQLRFRRCEFDPPWRADVRCAELLTPDSNPGAPGFRLPVMVLKASSSERRSDPILYLQGGPGAPAGLNRDVVERWLSWLEYAGVNRDLILLDRRGVGRSQPALNCPEYDDFSREILRENAGFERELEEGSAILRACFARLEAAGEFAPEAFGTRASAQDIIGLMSELEYREWNLIGVSYGSRLALAVAQQLEQSELPIAVRSLILDSVYPPHRGGLLSWPRVMTEGIERFIEWCQRDADCVDGERNLDAELHAALEQLSREPLSVSIELWRERRPVTMVLNDHRLMSAVFAAIYQRHRWPDIPRALAAVPQKDTPSLQPLLEPFVNLALDREFSSLAFMAVDCRDHRLGTEEEYQAAVDRHPRFRQYLDPLWHGQTCQWLGSAEQPLTLKHELKVPALLLAGELDPITPASWAEELTRQWPAAQLYRVDDTGHSVIGSEPCIHASLSVFLDNPRAKWQPQCGK